MQNFIWLIFLTLPFPALCQQQVLFADSLEERSEVYKVKSAVSYPGVYGHESYSKMKMAGRVMKNLNFYAEHFDDPQTVLLNKKLKVPAYLLRFAIDGTIAGGDPLFTNFNYNEISHFSYQLIGPDNHIADISGIRHAAQISWSIHMGNFGISSIKPDTSILHAEIKANDQTEPCVIDIVFQDEGENSVGGIALFEGDTIYIRTTIKGKKYRSTGVELYLHDKIIAGLQLPKMHIGPSYSVVDQSLSDDVKNLSYSILSVILYTNENRQTYQMPD
jgi:hypothetical protein